MYSLVTWGVSHPDASHVDSTFCQCPGFSWDRVNCLPSSWYSAMFRIQYEKNVDKTLMFSAVAK